MFVEVIVFLVSITLLIILIVRNEKKMAILKEYGKKYNKVIELNNECVFKNFYYNCTYNVIVDSKPRLDRLNLAEIAMERFYTNYRDLSSEHQRLKQLKQDYVKYVSNFDKIIDMKIEYKDELFINTIFKNAYNFKAYENKKVKSAKRIFKYSFKFKVNATYTSPKGRNSWYKYNDFSEIDFDDFIDVINKRSEYERSAKFQRSLMSDSLRYDILKRDNYTCQICGAAAKDGAKLEVDHIIPVSKGGKTEKSNLQTLCVRCNRGKSAK